MEELYPDKTEVEIEKIKYPKPLKEQKLKQYKPHISSPDIEIKFRKDKDNPSKIWIKDSIKD